MNSLLNMPKTTTTFMLGGTDMIYKATIVRPSESYSMVFSTMAAAEQWLDSENNNAQYSTMIEMYNEAGRKIDGFFYTEKKK